MFRAQIDSLKIPIKIPLIDFPNRLFSQTNLAYLVIICMGKHDNSNEQKIISGFKTAFSF